MQGKPTALHFLFAKETLQNSIWRLILERREIFLSRLCTKHFMGFANDQLPRITGTKGRGRKAQLPELEEKYGYDMKAAMPTLRVLYEGKEILHTGKISLPRAERELLIRVRTGRYSIDKVLDMANSLLVECAEEEKKSFLPDRIARRTVSEALARCYLLSWRKM